MSALPMHPTELDRERFRDLTKAIVAGLEYNRCPDGEYREATTQIAWRIWWSVERERQLLQNMNQSQGVKLSELLSRAEKAEAELAKLREQEPIKYLYRVIDCFGHDVLRDDPKDATILETIPLFASPVPAVADKRVDELAMLIRRLVRRLNQELPHNDIGEAAMDYLARNGISGEILRGWAAPVVPDAKTAGIIKRLRDACPAGYGCKCMVNDAASELERLSALLQSTPQEPTVPDDRVSQDESTLTMAASALVLFRAGESAEYMAKAIEALLQSAPQSGSEPVAHHPV